LLASLEQAGPAHATVQHPFGSHPAPYAAGSILPSHQTQPALDQAVRAFYDAWKDAYLLSRCGAGRYVVETRVGPGNLTVSEGHGYGMMIAVLMAGHDPDAQRIFDGMFAYFREHPTAFHDHLMSWNQKRSCANAAGNDSASDGDLDIAFALLLADKQWGSCGAVDYLAEAEAVIADIEAGELDTTGQYVLLGDWVTPSSGAYYAATRSSDFMPDHFRSFAAATSDPTWTAALDQGYEVFDAVQASHSPSTGLLPDFILDPLGTPAPAGADFLEDAGDGSYDYNACRDPWRVATDFLVSGETRAKDVVAPITAFIRTATGNDPSQIRSGYQLGGAPSPGTDYLSMAFVAPLGVAAMVDAANQAWLNDVWDLVVATPADAEGYYENTLKLLSMIVMSGNWWAPQAVPGGCTPSGTPLCTAGGYVAGAKVTLAKLGATPADEKLSLDGSLFFPQGIPVASLDAGAQILLEDLGSGGASVFELTEDTTPIPSVAGGACEPGSDGWLTTPKLTRYSNGSGALDPPACTAGSANGLYRIDYRARTARDFEFKVRAKDAALPFPVVGPLRATLVLGDDAAAGDAGACGVSGSLACSGSGTTLKCR
jgi:endoglucanase